MADQTTFIPKTTPQIKIPHGSRGLGWLMGLSSVFFILSLLLSFGLFFYKGLLEGEIKTLGENLAKVENEFEASSILELQSTAMGISKARVLFGEHAALSQIFKFLSANTLSDARFSNFSFQGGKAEMNGTAKSYFVLAQQALIFEKSRLIKEVGLSNFSLSSEGFVNFTLKFEVMPELISYKESIK